MNISEMHVWFRQYAQQMGMQNVRAILPEQIDVVINTSISDIINQIVRQNVGVKNGRVVSDVAKLNQINALHSLYKVVELDLANYNPFMDFLASNVRTGKMENTYTGVFSHHTLSTLVTPDNILYLVDFKLKYKVSYTGYDGLSSTDGNFIEPYFEDNALETEYFPVRFVDEAYLAETTTDYVLRSQLRSPIIVTYNNDKFELYVGRFRENVVVDDTDPDNIISTTYYTLDNKLVPYKLRFSYIAKPAEVRYVTDYNPALDNVDCNLPESMHIDILKHAVDLYMISIRGGFYNSQQPQQQVSSNEAQPTGGYQN